MIVRSRGLTLIEIMVTMGLFSIVGLLLAGSFQLATNVWRSTSATSSSLLTLNKARDDVTRDLQRTIFSSVRVAPGASSLGSSDGEAVWFLSAINPATGEFVRKFDGTPFWQCNILYYSVVPNNHATLFGFACSGGANGAGYEVQCPHKVLVRKVIDVGPATDPTDPTTEETPMLGSDLSTYLTRPNGYDTSALSSEPGVRDVSLPSTNILTFQAELAPDPEFRNEVRLEIGAVSILTAGREVRIGSTQLDVTRFYSDLKLSVFPGMI